MNVKEVNELRRRFNIDNTNITCIHGCYVNTKKEIISLFKLPPINLPQEESEKYLSLFKKVLSGTLGKNLVDIAFANEDVGVSDEHKLLMALRDTRLTDDDMVLVFFQRIIDALPLTDNALILLTHDAYDVPFKHKDKSRGDSEEMFNYITCAVCPVKLSRAALSYCPQDNEFHPNDPDWIVGVPEMGFLFPCFDERAANIYNALCYTKDTADNHTEFSAAVFGANPPRPAAEQKETFQAILQDTLAEECSLEVVQAVHDQMRERIAEQKLDKEAGPLKISSTEVKKALETCGVPQEKVVAFEEKYQEEFGRGMDVNAVNIVDTKQFEVRTPNVVIKVDPTRSDLVETRIINGSKYILIRADEGVEVNGVNISIQHNS